MPYRLVIVDDSPLYRLRLSQIFAASDKLQIVGLAGNGPEAISMIQARRPDVLLLDLDIPELDGFSVLRWTMQHAPMPVIVCSGQGGSEKLDFRLASLVVLRRPSGQVYDIGNLFMAL